MLSPSPSSDRVKSRDASATSPFGVLTLVVVSPASGRISGSCSSVLVGSYWVPVHVGPWEERGIFKRSALAFSASSAAMVLACYVRASACCAVSFAGVSVSFVESPSSGSTSGSNDVV